MDLGLAGRVAIVTGGSDGIGKASAYSLAAEGANVAILARRPDVLEAAAVEIRSGAPGEVMTIACDVTEQDKVNAAVQSVVDRWGRLDILVNNAGSSSAMEFTALNEDVMTADLRIKVYGAMYCSLAAIPHMQKAQWGRIVNITTPGGKAAPGGTLPTSLSRAAGIAMTKAMSKDLAGDNILVNTVCIGLIKSGQHRRRWELEADNNPSLTLDEWYERSSERVPLGRVGEASEAGDLVCFLASERASYITGTAVNMDGGVSPVV